ncbi:heavy metal translocating P-type ATPase [Celerinatantimonas sp. YJH-8]|uniref:heavy metal translocating P-type ATPase n=1 Tax=Celerinatantimonas sp. YJH-8 TaxID=3228714 RepID=UPI0038C71509
MSNAYTLPVEGMRCAGCVSRVEAILNEQPGVADVTVNLALNQAHFELADDASIGDVTKALDNAGYPVPLQRQQWKVAGMRCAGCSAAVERALNKVPGVLGAEVNYALGQATVSSLPDSHVEDVVVKAIENAGYQVEDNQPVKSEAPQTRADFPWRLVVSLVLTIPLVVPMLISTALPGWLQWLLATPVQFILGWPFYKGAWHALRSRAGSMDTLVAMGTSAAYFYSVWLYLSGLPHLYFDGAAVIITLILAGKALEDRAKKRAAKAISTLINEAPMQAHRLQGDVATDIAVDDLVEGDWVLVKPGEKVPADGIVRWGQSEFNEALITGESAPVAHQSGETVLAGSLNGEGLVKVEVTRANADSTLGRMIQMVSDAQAGKAPVQKLADQISFYFVPVVLTIALVTLVLWGIFGTWSGGITAAISVLVIACPCSLGLATPTALVAGTGSGAKYGILFRNIDALERTRQINQVVFDKTGTLTEGNPTLASVLADNKEQLLQWVASAQQGSQHPLAKAMLAANQQPLIELDYFNSYPGMGIEAHLKDSTQSIILVGNQALLQQFHVAMDTSLLEQAGTLSEQGQNTIFVAKDGQMIGVLSTTDVLRTNAVSAVKQLQAHQVAAVMLTGDQHQVAERIARQLSLDDWASELKPEDKLAQIRDRQSRGGKVLMVGDGVNDAPALAQADVGIAMGSGSDLAIESADVALMRDDPLLVSNALLLARKTWRIIQQNLFWAFCYNVIGIPLAASGMLSPAIAGAAMALSSLSVVSNSVRLTRWKPRQEE